MKYGQSYLFHFLGDYSQIEYKWKWEQLNFDYMDFDGMVKFRLLIFKFFHFKQAHPATLARVFLGHSIEMRLNSSSRNDDERTNNNTSNVRFLPFAFCLFFFQPLTACRIRPSDSRPVASHTHTHQLLLRQ
jgi:hypothetical protein